MQTAERPVRAARLRDVVDLEPVGFAHLPIPRIGAAGRLVPAARATVLVTSFHGAARERPPVIVPKALRAAVAAPHPAAWRERRAAPAARPFGVRREAAGFD